MLVCVYRTLSTFLMNRLVFKSNTYTNYSNRYNFHFSTNSVNLILIYTISRHRFLFRDARQMVLDILIWIKSNIDRTLSFRSSCCEGVCGSCAMLINNVNTLACIQPVWLIHSYLMLYPLPHFNVVRDLVIDLKHFYEQYTYVNPFYNLYDSSNYTCVVYHIYVLLCIYLNKILIPNEYSFCNILFNLGILIALKLIQLYLFCCYLLCVMDRLVNRYLVEYLYMQYNVLYV